MPDNGPSAAQELLLLIERWERLQEEKEGIASDQKDVMAEAKSRGYDTKTIRDIIRLRKMRPEERREREALLDTYKAALGMLDGTPLGTWAIERLSKKNDELDPEPANSPDDETYARATALVIKHQNVSTAWLQRQLRIGYNAASALLERMQREEIVSAPDSNGKRDVLQQPGSGGGEEGTAPDAPEPEPTVEDARQMGGDAARAGAPVTANPFPPRDPRRAAWDEAWCQALGSDGMDIPDALKPTPKPKKPGAGEGEEPRA